MSNLLLIAFIITGVAITVMAGVLVWLVRAHQKLKYNYRVLTDIIDGINNDIAGMCSAALKVNSRLASTDEHFNELMAKISEYQENAHSSNPYSGDIRKIRSGATVDELMQASGLSHDEAALLIRLHGSKTQS